MDESLINKLFVGNALTKLKHIDDDTVDLVITSPPYWDMLNMKGAENQAKRKDKGLQTNYSNSKEDLGNIDDYNLIKELRNGWSAFWYNNTAKLFNMSLKKEFNPYTVEEDYLIEDIIQRALRDKKLEYQEPSMNYDLFELNKKWKKIN